MKKFIFILALFPITLFAQSNGLPAGMANMLQKAQSCMQNIDTSQLENLEAEGKQMEAKIKSLCESGKQKEAQEQAIAYSREMMARPEFKQIRQCGEMLRGMMPEMPFDNMEEKLKNKNICDEL